MLDPNALAELSKLKKIIEDNKDSGEGIIRGSQGRYGFVNLDDGRSVYLSAEEMQRVLPGDRVLVEVVTNDKKKLEAKLEKLVQKNFKTFVGTYSVKGNAHFVIPDHRETSRGLFVPPKERKKFADGDFVQCQLSRHPFADGKSQVKIINAIGKRDDVGIEHRFIAFKHTLTNPFNTDAEKQAEQLLQASELTPSDGLEDLSHLPFVTIDSASTEDLDDALYAEAIETESNDKAWILYSAIADPSTLVTVGSALDKEAKQRASSVYFPGQVIPMFPTALTIDTFSLTPNKLRSALVCKIQLSADGSISSWQFMHALVKSRAKLSYDGVKDYIENGKGDGVDEAIGSSLDHLHQIANARKTYRQQNNIVQDDNVDYHYRLNSQMQIESVSVRQPNSAHRLVEEAMLATNCCAGEELSNNNIEGALYSCHLGFRNERVQEIQHLLKLEKPDYDSGDIETFAGFQRLMKTLSENADDRQLLCNLRRLLQSAYLSTEANPHFGLGFERYALITSPIRRFQDLHNHRLIKSLLVSHQSTNGKVDDQKLQEKISVIRSAQRELNQRLLCRYMANDQGKEFEAKVVAVSSQGLALRVIENGAESFLPLRKGPNQTVKYDSVRLTLTVNDVCYAVEQTIKVKLEKVDISKYQLQLALV